MNRSGSVLAVGMLAAWAGLSAAAGAEEGTLSFLPTPSGNVGAFLVAGPFERPQGAIEQMAPAREAGELPGGLSWRLVTTRDGNGVVVGGEGGIYYARTEFAGEGAGRRALSIVASCRFTAWAASCEEGLAPDPATAEIVTAPAYTRKKLTVEAGVGPTVLLIKLEPTRARAGFAVRAGMLVRSGRVLPEGGRLRLADTSPERLGRLVQAALRLRVTPKLASENSPVLVEFTRVGSPPDLPGEVEIELAALEDEFLQAYRGKPSRRLALGELGREHVTANFMVDPGAPGLFTIEARVSREGKRLATLTGTGFVSEGLRGLAGSLEERGRSLANTFPSVGAYARLQADKIRLSFERRAGPREPQLLAEDIELAERGLREAEAGRDFQKGLTGFHERAYVSDIDDSAQPYLVYVPTFYRPGEPLPLVVYLHGYVPTYDKDNWLMGDPQVNAVMEAEGCILVIPFGRSNTDFLNVGEDDVLAVIDEMKRHYSIDPRRIYLYGYSMGGSGVWTMITHFPDRFAAAVVLAGRTDYFLWHRLRREDMPPWRRFIIETDNPIDYVENIVHVPVRIYHGASDYVIKTDQSKIMAEKLKAAGGTCELYWIPRGTHWTMFDTVLWTRAPVAWMKKHVLPEKPPEEFNVTARHPRYAGAWGFEADAFLRWMEPAIASFATDAEGLHVMRDQKNVGMWTTTFKLGQGWRSSARPPFRLCKRSDLAGPIKDAFRSPFCIVYGTTGDEEEKREVKANAERFRKEWRGFAKGWAPIFADTEVTNELMTKKNLVIFGEPETNSLLASFADSLPIKWNRDEAEIAGRTYSMKDRGLAFVYPNPKYAQRAIIVFSGIPWGSHLPPNHKWDLLPDFILYTPDADMIDTMEKTNEWVVAGFFGTDWSLESGRIFVKGVGEVDAEGNPLAPEAHAMPPPEPEPIPEAPPGFRHVR